MRKVVAVVTDTHNGHPLSLPPNGDSWNYIDGGRKPISGWQERIWNHWEDCWRHVGDLRKGAELIVAHLSDPIEGNHHGTLQLLTSRINEQEAQHVSAMQEALAFAKFKPRKDKLFYFSGTPEHCGNGNSSTERIVRALLNAPEADGSMIRPHLYASVNGVIFDMAHKSYNGGNREWTAVSAMRSWLTNKWFENLQAGIPMPRYYVRGHFHTYRHVEIEDKHGRVVSEAFLAPAWKLRDEYVEQFAPDAVNNIGLIAFVIEGNGQCKDYPMLMECRQDEIEEL